MRTRVEHRGPLRPGELPLRIVRSRRRRTGATAFPRDGHIEVRLPAHLPDEDAERTIRTLVDRVTRRERARRRGGDQWLQDRAERVAGRYLPGTSPGRVTWSSRMTRRWASATPATGEIRISDVVATFPDRVLDYLLVHELAHLRVPDHSEEFHALVAALPYADWARGFLAGVSHATAVVVGHPPSDSSPSDSSPSDSSPSDDGPSSSGPAGPST